MQALSLFVSRLERRGMDDVAREIVCDIRESVNTLSSLLNALLDISKLDAGMTRATMEDVPLDELFRSIARDFGPVAERKGCVFACARLPTVPLFAAMGGCCGGSLAIW